MSTPSAFSLGVDSPMSRAGTFARPAIHQRIGLRAAQGDEYSGQIVRAALERSFTVAQVGVADSGPAACTAWINPPEAAASELARSLAEGGKALVFGRLGPAVADVLGLSLSAGAQLQPEWGECPIDPARHHDTSPAVIRYTDHPLARSSPWAERPLCRFDFADEWNNLGFGRVRLDGSPWALAGAVVAAGAEVLARLDSPQGPPLVYAALCESSNGAALWINRPVGPVDSLEWRLVESFVSDYRAADLPCLPCVNEIPFGYSAAVCPRLDCDEAVGSARQLCELYHDQGLPLSLALLTGQPLAAADFRLLRQVLAGRGAVVSHSVRHEPRWGGSYERALAEANESRAWLEANLPESAPVRYAVSPFHQNPPAVVAALADAGYQGFVGGIIANDPEYLLGRAGRVPFAPRPLVSKSTQCMLHGDCLARYGGSVEPYCQSFDHHRAAGSVFGYLDHPFSTRYQYGWSDEAARIAAHEGLIKHIVTSGDVWWANLTELFDFLRQRDAARLQLDAGGELALADDWNGPRHTLGILWKGREFAC